MAVCREAQSWSASSSTAVEGRPGIPFLECASPMSSKILQLSSDSTTHKICGLWRTLKNVRANWIYTLALFDWPPTTAKLGPSSGMYIAKSVALFHGNVPMKPMRPLPLLLALQRWLYRLPLYMFNESSDRFWYTPAHGQSGYGCDCEPVQCGKCISIEIARICAAGQCIGARITWLLCICICE